MKIRSIKEKQEEFRRKEVLGIALSIFSEKGYHNTKMLDIAKACGISVGSLYNIFRNKEELYASLFEEKIEETFRFVEKEAEKGGAPLESIERMTRAYFRAASEYGEFIRLFIEEVTLRKERKMKWKERVSASFMRHLNSVKNIIKALSGIENDQIALLLSLCYLGMVHQIAIFHVRNKMEIDEVRITELVMKVLKEGIMKKEER